MYTDVKPFDLGFVIGRFQHFHNGHKSLVDTAIKLCDRVLIFVGSAQESGTLRNPFPTSTRIDIIRQIYGVNNPNFIIKELNDLTNENDITTDWGKYLLDNVVRHVRKKPSLMVYGNDEFRSRWFAAEDLTESAEFIVPRSRIPISATLLREALVKDDYQYWAKFVDEKLHKHYDKLRSELLRCAPYQHMYENLLSGKDLYDGL